MLYERICPQCGQTIYHTSKYNRNALDKKGLVCKSCASANNWKNNTSYKLNFSSTRQHNIEKYKTDEYRKSQSKKNKGTLNKMYGQTFYDVWVKKYGEKIANEKMQEWRKKQKEATPKGEKNPMFGKSSPQGSGNGWSGWYNNFYFRSLRELSFLYHFKDCNIQTADCSEYRVKYDFFGKQRTYSPDFVIGNTVYEIKPKKLWNTKTVQLKKNAAEKKFKEMGLNYILIDPEVLTNAIIFELHSTGKIKFLEKYEKKYLNEYVFRIHLCNSIFESVSSESATSSSA